MRGPCTWKYSPHGRPERVMRPLQERRLVQVELVVLAQDRANVVWRNSSRLGRQTTASMTGCQPS